MKPFHNFAWMTAALLATVLAAGCDRNKPATTSGAPDRMSERAAERMDQAATDIRENAAQGKDQAKDAATTTKVKTAIVAEPGLKGLEIHVDTANGVVILTGAVDSPQSLERATQVAQGVDGVKSVDNRLNLKSRA